MSFVDGVASNNGAGGTTIVATMPINFNGDVLLMCIVVRGGTGTTITDPAGWTLLGAQVNSGTTLASKLYWRVAASEPASYTVTITSNKATAVIADFGPLPGIEGNVLVSAFYAGQANASSLTVTAPATGTWNPVKGTMLWIGGIAFASETTTPAPAGYSDPTAAMNSVNTGGSTASRTQIQGYIQDVTTESQTTIGSTSATWTGTAAVNIGWNVFVPETLNKFLYGRLDGRAQQPLMAQLIAQ